MSLLPSRPNENLSLTLTPQAAPGDDLPDEGAIDLSDFFARVWSGAAQIVGLAALGIAIAGVVWLLSNRFQSTTTSIRVAFSFAGYSRGQYPDHSKLEPDDLRAPDVVVAALQRVGLDKSADFQSKLRAALTVEGIIPTAVIAERDRLRSTGQTPARYLPDEFVITLTLPKQFPLSEDQRRLFLYALVNAYQQKFQDTYASVPATFGNLQSTLAHADFEDYEQILGDEIRSIEDYLTTLSTEAPTFRSRTTNLSFNDLLKESQLFTDVYMNETLGLIRMSSLSRDRKVALLKMDYQLQVLYENEKQAAAEEQTTRDLLTQAEAHTANYVLGIKSQATQAPQGTAPILDQGLVDSLLANDTYNFMMRQALTASLKVKDIQSEEARVAERRKALITAMQAKDSNLESLVEKASKSVQVLDSAYSRLIGDITRTYADYAKQKFADAIRVTMQPTSPSKYRPLAIDGVIGGFLGLATGVGLSLLGVYLGSKSRPSGASPTG